MARSAMHEGDHHPVGQKVSVTIFESTVGSGPGTTSARFCPRHWIHDMPLMRGTGIQLAHQMRDLHSVLAYSPSLRL